MCFLGVLLLLSVCFPEVESQGGQKVKVRSCVLGPSLTQCVFPVCFGLVYDSVCVSCVIRALV